MTEETMVRLRMLHGVWRGQGHGEYPTIDPFDYEEELRFELDESYPMLHYEQRTRLVPSAEPSHWESGFVRPLEDGSIEISSSQDSGRVEVLRGRAEVIGADRAAWVLTLDSVVLQHDPRLVRTRRILELRRNALSYTAYMSTTTTPQPRLLQHLKASLKRTG